MNVLPSAEGRREKYTRDIGTKSVLLTDRICMLGKDNQPYNSEAHSCLPSGHLNKFHTPKNQPQ